MQWRLGVGCKEGEIPHSLQLHLYRIFICTIQPCVLLIYNLLALWSLNLWYVFFSFMLLVLLINNINNFDLQIRNQQTSICRPTWLCLNWQYCERHCPWDLLQVNIELCPDCSFTRRRQRNGRSSTRTARWDLVVCFFFFICIYIYLIIILRIDLRWPRQSATTTRPPSFRPLANRLHSRLSHSVTPPSTLYLYGR